MRPFIRRSVLVLLASVALLCGAEARPASGCVLEQLSSAGAAETLLRAGRLVVVKTTVAFARALKHEALAYRGAIGTVRTGGR